MAFGIQADLGATGDNDFKKLEDKPKPKVEVKSDDKAKDIDLNALQDKKQPEPILEPLQKKEPNKAKASEQDKVAPELTDDAVNAYLKSKYFKDKDFNGIDDLLKVPEPTIKEVEKAVNPWEDVFDENEEAYFKFKRETGNGRKEWDYVQQDFKSKSALELSIDKVKFDTGLNLSRHDSVEYLEKELGVELDGELSTTDKIKLNAFAKPFRDEQIALQEKYKAPMDEALRNKKANQVSEKIVTPDGRQLSPEAYQEELQSVREDYINNVTKGVSSATGLSYDIEFDDNGEKRNFTFKYDYSEKDKHSMLSDASDVDAMLKSRYNTEHGFNHSELAQGLWKGSDENIKRLISLAMQQARAQTIEELASDANNENFSRKPLETRTKAKEGYGNLEDGITGHKTGFGVKANF